jgi:hypothetical protein
VGSAVDSARQTGDDDEVLLSEIVGKAAREAACSRGSIACADDRDCRPVEQLEIAPGHE